MTAKQYKAKVKTIGGFSEVARKLGINRQTMYLRCKGDIKIRGEAIMAIEYLLMKKEAEDAENSEALNRFV